MLVPWPMPSMATASQALALPSEMASTMMPPTGTNSTARASRDGVIRSAKIPNTTRAATWLTPIRAAAIAAWRSVQPWSVRYGMRCTIAALMAPIDRVNAMVRPSIAGSRTSGATVAAPWS